MYKYTKSNEEKKIMKSLYRTEIRNLEDKDLQLRYMLGGLNRNDGYKACGYNTFFACDIKCSCMPVADDECLYNIKKFIEKHNISNETFMRLVRTHLKGWFYSFENDSGSLLPELEEAISNYNFERNNDEFFRQSRFKERELLKLVKKQIYDSESEINFILQKYSISVIDFMILAKTSLNYGYAGGGFEQKDLSKDIVDLLQKHNLYESKEEVKKYQKRVEGIRPRVLVKKIKNLFE